MDTPVIKAKMAAVEQDLWIKYWQHRTVRDRNILVEYYLPYCYKEFKFLTHKYDSSVDVDALTQNALIGLIKSIDKYDGSVLFLHYCSLRLRGAMADERRSTSRVPRKVRSSKKRRLQLVEEGKDPQEHMDEASYKESFIVRDVPIETEKEGQLSDAVMTFTKNLFLDDDYFKYYCRGCSFEEQTILYLYYYKGNSNRKIGEVMNISQAGVQKIHSQALERLRGIFTMGGML